MIWESVGAVVFVLFDTFPIGSLIFETVPLNFKPQTNNYLKYCILVRFFATKIAIGIPVHYLSAVGFLKPISNFWFVYYMGNAESQHPGETQRQAGSGEMRQCYYEVLEV